jgi:hypothetical protein
MSDTLSIRGKLIQLYGNEKKQKHTTFNNQYNLGVALN